MARATLEPTWARFGAGNAQLSFFHRSGVVFGRFLMDFTSFLIDFSCYVRYICWLFREGFGMNFARALKEFYIFWSLLIIQLSHFKMSAQTPIFGHFSFDHSHILKCPLRPFFSHILLLIIQFSHFKMSAQTPPFGHFTSDHSVLTFRNVDFE